MFYGGYQPQPMPMQPMQPMQTMQPIQQPQVRRPAGGWLTAKDYNEVQGMPIPADGTQTLVMLENEPIFYVLQMLNGMKVVQGYTFAVMQNQQNVAPKVTMEDRLAKIENVLKDLMGDEKNESDNKPE